MRCLKVDYVGFSKLDKCYLFTRKDHSEEIAVMTIIFKHPANEDHSVNGEMQILCLRRYLVSAVFEPHLAEEEIIFL
ncbi:hypothetical protein I7I53_09060 [Histoplasma capsulatum var. duboisii H88]|uniref:Uncharacterized protein n=1 Tax=Ajellomyces capsulatus (strain H88) TaxID=544711 RepID=A0A8A1L3D0_AJEC8|nr:hypothetical protein I7I53_09060 [Histoplasma capsulatum var. duboisii H88]